MEITEDFFTDRIFCRKGAYWKVFKLTNLCESNDGYDATVECIQTFASQLTSPEDRVTLILNTLLIELDMDDKIELVDGWYLNIVHEYAYKETNKKRFLVNISTNPNDEINKSEYMARVMYSCLHGQM